MSRKNALQRGATFIAKQQHVHGGFTSYSSSQPRRFVGALRYETTFFPSLILHALNEVTVPVARAVRDRTAEYLLQQKSEHWSFNYWDKDSKNYTAKPYPDDLDDTFSALAALWGYDRSLFDGGAFAKVAHLLVATEHEVGGPYHTWLADKKMGKKWQDVDVLVNANVAWFLGLQDIALPKLVGFCEQAINDNNLRSPYYPTIYPIIYALSRVQLSRAARMRLQDVLLEARDADGCWETPLQTALAVTTLLRLGHSADDLRLVQNYLYDAQQADGGWRAEAFCIDPARDGVTYYAGARSLTTAYALEALALLQKAEQLSATKTGSLPSIPYHAATEAVEATIERIERPELQQQVSSLYKQIRAQDNDFQIVSLPWLVARTAGISLQKEFATDLAVGSVWGWMTYTALDDVFDGDVSPTILPSVAFSLRQLMQTLHKTTAASSEFQQEAQIILERIDAANAWEQQWCRGQFKGATLHMQKLPDYGDYWQLADRSLGHCIAALGVLYRDDDSTKVVQRAALRTFFRHYIIARQLNDDAHDWEEDLHKGHINPVAAMILQNWQANKRTVSLKINVQRESKHLQSIMWNDVITVVCTQVQEHVTIARTALATANFADTSVLAQVLDPVAKAADDALVKRQDALKFIDTF